MGSGVQWSPTMLCLPTCSESHVINVAHQRGSPDTPDEPTHWHIGITQSDHITAPSWCCTICGFGQTHCGMGLSWYRTGLSLPSNFSVLRLLALPFPPAPSPWHLLTSDSLHSWAFSRTSYAGNHAVGNLSDSLLSLSDVHLICYVVLIALIHLIKYFLNNWINALKKTGKIVIVWHPMTITLLL